MTINSILVLDDEQNTLDLLVHLLSPHFPCGVTATRHPTKAIQLARENCFDLLLLDITINYRGTEFGGLEVYKTLLGRYGAASILAYSQYIDDGILERFGLSVNFIERGPDLMVWARRVADELVQLRNRQTCFVAMPFGSAFDDLFLGIRACVEAAGYRCVRVDRQSFTKSIVDKIFEEIRKAKFVIFVAASQNPNAFYEAGFSVALEKEVITITDSYNNLPFDVRDRSALTYNASALTVFFQELSGRLATITVI
jgi:CheY-like chemotaxis protein